jgi:hypothetical protein
VYSLQHHSFARGTAKNNKEKLLQEVGTISKLNSNSLGKNQFGSHKPKLEHTLEVVKLGVTTGKLKRLLQRDVLVSTNSSSST